MYRMLGFFSALALVLVTAIGAGAAAGALTANYLLEAERAKAVVDATGPERDETAGSGIELLSTPGEDRLLEAVRATRPAVVTVQNLQNYRESVFAPIRMRVAGTGSGAIFDERGYIATNAHVVRNAAALEVVFIDGRSVTAEIVNWDPGYDIAILKVPDGTELPAVAPFADSSELEPGMKVLAIGSPLGTDYQNTVTEGIIAGLNRRVKEQGFDLRTFEYRERDIVEVPLIQTDAAINVGNSGGPLIDMRGQIVGINTLVVRRDQRGGSSVEGFGFSVPSNVVQALADEWIDGQARADLGATVEDIDPQLARESGLDRSAGAVVNAIRPDGAAARAGLQVGDIIIAVNGTTLNLDRALGDQLWRYHAGERIRLSIDRYGELLEIEVQLGGVEVG